MNGTVTSSKDIDDLINNVIQGNTTIPEPYEFKDMRQKKHKNNSSKQSRNITGIEQEEEHEAPTGHKKDENLATNSTTAKNASKRKSNIAEMLESNKNRSKHSNYISDDEPNDDHQKMKRNSEKTKMTPPHVRRRNMLDALAHYRDSPQPLNCEYTHKSTSTNANTQSQINTYTGIKQCNNTSNKTFEHKLHSQQKRKIREIKNTSIDELRGLTNNNEFYNNIKLNNHFSPLDNINQEYEEDKHKNTTPPFIRSNTSEKNSEEEIISKEIRNWCNNKDSLQEDLFSKFEIYQGKLKEVIEAQIIYRQAADTYKEKLKENTDHTLEIIQANSPRDINKEDTDKIQDIYTTTTNNSMSYGDASMDYSLSDPLANLTEQEKHQWTLLNDKLKQNHSTQINNQSIPGTSQQASATPRNTKTNHKSLNNITKSESLKRKKFSNDQDIDKFIQCSPNIDKDIIEEEEFIPIYILIFKANKIIDSKFHDPVSSYSALKETLGCENFDVTFNEKEKDKVMLRTRSKEIYERIKAPIQNIFDVDELTLEKSFEKKGAVKQMKIVINKAIPITQREKCIEHLKKVLSTERIIQKHKLTNNGHTMLVASIYDPNIYKKYLGDQDKGEINVGGMKVACYPWKVSESKTKGCYKCYEFNHVTRDCDEPRTWCAKCAYAHDRKTKCQVHEIRCITCLRRKHKDYYHYAFSKHCPVYRRENNLIANINENENQNSNNDIEIMTLHKPMQEYNSIQQSYSQAVTLKQNDWETRLRKQDFRSAILLEKLNQFDRKNLTYNAGILKILDINHKEEVTQFLAKVKDEELNNHYNNFGINK